MILYGGSKPPPYAQSPSTTNRQNKRYAFHSVSALAKPTPAPPIIQRACRQCVHESARLFRVICSHAWYSLDCGERQNRRFSLCPFAARTCHAWLVRITRARRRWFGRRTARVLLADFWYFSSRKSTIKEKLLYVSSRVVDGADPYKKKTTYSQ